MSLARHHARRNFDPTGLFVEEMTKAGIESGALREGEDAYHLDGPLSALAIPTTLHDSLMARLNRLHPGQDALVTRLPLGPEAMRIDSRHPSALSLDLSLGPNCNEKRLIYEYVTLAVRISPSAPLTLQRRPRRRVRLRSHAASLWLPTKKYRKQPHAK